ncbi:mediator of RNA polymerase II transcription subunit 25-like [Carex rostrata]
MLHDPDSSAAVTGEVSKHCVLACASNPYVLPTLVYLPSVEKNENGETIQPSFLADAEAVAKCFSQCSVSLSVISPNQLPKLRDIYNAGKRGARPADPSVDQVKHAQHLLLLSDSFLEARSALNCPISAHLVPNPGVVKLEEPTTAPVSVPVTGSTLQNSSKSGGNMKACMCTCMGQSMRNVGSQMGQCSRSMVMNQPVIGGGIGSGPGSVMPTPGMTQQSGGVNPMGMGSNSGMNMPLPQQHNAQGSQSKYVRIWEGTLSGQRQGKPVFICRLEGYRSASASDTLAADWPSTMQIIRFIAEEHMNNKQYVGKAEFLVFRTLNQHGLLGQLQEKKLCAVIQLPSQTLLLSVSDKAGCLIGMLIPGDESSFPSQPYRHTFITGTHPLPNTLRLNALENS